MEAPRREPERFEPRPEVRRVEGEERLEPRSQTYRPEEPIVRERTGPRIVGRPEFAPMEMEHEDIISWGAVWAGLVGAFAVLVLLSLIGVGIGLSSALSAGGPGAPTGTATAVWAIVVTAIAFFFGGWLAAQVSTYATAGSGLLHGGLVWALALLVSVGFAIVGLGSLLGLPTANVLGILGLPPTPTATSATTVWTTVLGLTIGLVAALVGGVLGSRKSYSYYR